MTLRKVEQKFDSDVILSFRFIPNVLNYLSSLFSRKRRMAVITGLGYAFIPTNSSIKHKLQRYLIKTFYHIASKRVQIIAQNSDDLKDIDLESGKVILGSGVAANHTNDNFCINTNSIKLLFAGRLLKSKGIYFAIDVFNYLKILNPNVTLAIAGTIDPDNPDSISKNELYNLMNIDGLDYLGYVSDMSTVYRNANVLLFPSVYREGIPRVIIEATKHGLTIITRDLPGCRETIYDNGFLITKNNTLKDVVRYLNSLDSSSLLNNSENSKNIFSTKFSTEVIYPQYLELLE
jgi:glycosyltransferase involved in cell wall biosynthesis